MARSTADILGDWQIFFFLGIAGVFFGGFFLLIGLILLFIGADIYNMFLLGFTPLALVPGIILMAVGMRKHARVKDLESLAGILKTYRRIKISKVAEKLGVNQIEAERRIAICVDNGWVKGYIDRNTEEFFTLESLGQVVRTEGCPNCGAPPERIVLIGEQAKCGSCGAVVTPPGGWESGG